MTAIVTLSAALANIAAFFDCRISYKPLRKHRHSQLNITPAFLFSIKTPWVGEAAVPCCEVHRPGVHLTTRRTRRASAVQLTHTRTRMRIRFPATMAASSMPSLHHKSHQSSHHQIHLQPSRMTTSQRLLHQHKHRELQLRPQMHERRSILAPSRRSADCSNSRGNSSTAMAHSCTPSRRSAAP